MTKLAPRWDTCGQELANDRKRLEWTVARRASCCCVSESSQGG